METRSAHRLHAEAEARPDPQAAFRLGRYAQALMHASLPVMCSLGHLARIAGVTTNYSGTRLAASGRPPTTGCSPYRSDAATGASSMRFLMGCSPPNGS